MLLVLALYLHDMLKHREMLRIWLQKNLLKHREISLWFQQKCWKHKQHQDNWHVVSPLTEDISKQMKRVGHEDQPVTAAEPSFWELTKVAFLAFLFLLYTCSLVCSLAGTQSFLQLVFSLVDFLDFGSFLVEDPKEIEFRRISKAYEILYDEYHGLGRREWEDEMARCAWKQTFLALVFSLLVIRSIKVVLKAKVSNEATNKHRTRDWNRALAHLRSDNIFLLLAVIFSWCLLKLLSLYYQMKRDEVENPFQVLGISDASTLLEVKKAYRRLSMHHYPD